MQMFFLVFRKYATKYLKLDARCSDAKPSKIRLRLHHQQRDDRTIK